MVKSLLGEILEDFRIVGVNPFYVLNAPPPVSIFHKPFVIFPLTLITFTLLQFSVAHLNTRRLSILEKETTSCLPVKKLKTNTHGLGRRKKSAAEDLLKLDDSEVELDSLGHLFTQLIDADSS